MDDRACAELLQWAAPRLGLRPEGFRRVRGQVCKRIGRRMKELGLQAAAEYRRRLEADGSEWQRLDALCRVSISRFYRDREVFRALAEELLPALLAGRGGAPQLRVWSAGCASGEEPYSVAILCECALRPRFPGLEVQVLATDADPGLVERARRGCYRKATLRELPPEWIDRAFSPGKERCLRDEFRRPVELCVQDLRRELPQGPFDLILCRNLAFTYFDAEGQRRALAALLERLPDGGLLAIGAHEELPASEALERASGALPIFRKLHPRT